MLMIYRHLKLVVVTMVLQLLLQISIGKPFLPNEPKHVKLDKNQVDMLLKYKGTQDNVVPSSTNSKFLMRVIYP